MTFEEFRRDYCLNMWGNAYIMDDGSRPSGLTPHGEDLLAGFAAGMEEAAKTAEALSGSVPYIANAIRAKIKEQTF